jgi:hypothetical protein
MTIPDRLHSINDRQADEGQPLRRGEDTTNYGSFIPTPPGPPSLLELPDPALDPNDAEHPGQQGNKENGKRRAQPASNAYEIGKTQSPSTKSPTHRLFRHRRTFSQPDVSVPRPFIHRILTTGGSLSKKRGDLAPYHRDVPLESYRELDLRQAEFFGWMDKELAKIEQFYKEKENHASERLLALRQQLHEMRDRRLHEVIDAERNAQKNGAEHESEGLLSKGQRLSEELTGGRKSYQWFRPIETAMGSTAKAIPRGRFGKTTQAMQHLATPQGPKPSSKDHYTDNHRDFVRRQAPSDDVPYRQAKRKLKAALAEYYRGLELLKSYALLNRTAFRKINKKYDKTVHARPTGRYMAEKVNDAYFVQSAVLDGHLQTVEDLYARYFERGNHKIAVGKLRKKGPRAGEHYTSVYRNGLLLGASLVLGVQALINGEDNLHDPDPVLRIRTAYLLQVCRPPLCEVVWPRLTNVQIYAGYFLALLLVLYFTLACRVWTRAKINYAFVFEFDTRDSLDWRQLAEVRSCGPVSASCVECRLT